MERRCHDRSFQHLSSHPARRSAGPLSRFPLSITEADLAETQPIIEASGLKRTFKARGQKGKPIEAVRGIDLKVSEGEIVGFLGPNGAGKTTTLKMLCTLLEPTGGTATVVGQRPPHAIAVGVRRTIGYVSQAGSTSPEARGGRRDQSATPSSTASTARPRSSAARSCSPRSTSAMCGTAPAARCRAGSGGGSTSSWG